MTRNSISMSLWFAFSLIAGGAGLSFVYWTSVFSLVWVACFYFSPTFLIFLFLLKYSWFTVFQVYSKVIQIHIYAYIHMYIYIFFFRSLLFIYFIYSSVYLLIPNFKFIPPHFSPLVTISLFFMSVSLFLFCISSFVSFFFRFHI